MAVIKEYKNKRGQFIGWLDDKEIFRKEVKLSNLMKIHDSWGVDKHVIDDLQGKCQSIRIKDDKGNIYSVAYDHFVDKQIVQDFGHGEQCFLPRQYFHKNDNAHG